MRKQLSGLMTAAALVCAAPAMGAVISTAMGTGSDAQVSEDYSATSGTVSDSGSGGSSVMGARFNASATGVNEFIVLRFDLSGVDKSSISNAVLTMVANRTSTNNTKQQRIWGVNSGVANLNTFAEGTKFSQTPGLTWDGDASTQGIVDASTTFLGRFAFTDPGEGGNLVINQALLNSSSETAENTIDGFLQSLGTADEAVFLIGGAGVSNGQLQVLSKEATQSSTGVVSGAAGTFAPTLSYAVPEPASLGLLGVATIGVLGRRRRA